MTRPPNPTLLLPLLMMTTGCDVRIGRPGLLWLLWLVPIMAVFYAWAFRRKRVLLERFASAEMLKRLTSQVSGARQVFKAVLILVALAAGLLALAELKYGFTWEEVRREGVDIVIALDVSDSMLVEDAESGGKLSRLERAKREISDLLDLLEGDRVGLVAFAGTAFLECPLTLDYAAAAIFLDALDTELIPVKGTAIGTALRTAMEAFDNSAQESRAVILITDGEDHLGDALDVAETAARENIRIFTIGIGRDEGAPIPRPGGGFRRDRRGEIILSKLDETTLQKIALATGGRYVRSVTGDVDLEQIYLQGIKATLADRELGATRRQRWKDRFQWLLALALICLMVEPLVSERLRRRPGRATGARPLGQAGKAAATSALALVMAAGGARAQPPPPTDGAQPLPQQLSERELANPYRAYEAGAYDRALEGFVDRQVERPDDPALKLNIGSARYQMNDYEEAVSQYSQAALAGDQLLRSEALYNLGNTAYRQGKLGEAIDFYMGALDLNPDDEDAKFNLEFVRDEVRRRQEEAEKRQQEQQQQQQSQEQGEDGEQDQQQGGEGEQEQSGDQDRDGDGLPDDVERLGQNPTDPSNPDTDGDGQLDGEEDQNRNGQVDPGETDPNQPDGEQQGDQDGPAGEEQESEPQQSGAPQAQQQSTMSPEEAERFLQSLEERRPDSNQQKRPGRRVKVEKDW